MFLAEHFCRGCLRPGERQAKSLGPEVDRLDGLIGPGGLLLVVSDLLQSQFYKVVLGKN